MTLIEFDVGQRQSEIAGGSGWDSFGEGDAALNPAGTRLVNGMIPELPNNE